MTLQDWISAHWRRPGETATRAIERLAIEWGVTYKTLFYAARGARVSPDTARTVEEKTSGAVRAETLVLNPTRAELAEASHPQSVAPAATDRECA